MATQDFTETPVIDRETARRLNPFISYLDCRETLECVTAGLSALGFAVASMQVQCESECYGLQLLADTLRAALVFETEAQRQGGAL